MKISHYLYNIWSQVSAGKITELNWNERKKQQPHINEHTLYSFVFLIFSTMVHWFQNPDCTAPNLLLSKCWCSAVWILESMNHRRKNEEYKRIKCVLINMRLLFFSFVPVQFCYFAGGYLWSNVVQVVRYFHRFKFSSLLFWGMVMYDNEFKTKEKKIWTKDKIESQQIYLTN